MLKAHIELFPDQKLFITFTACALMVNLPSKLIDR